MLPAVPSFPRKSEQMNDSADTPRRTNRRLLARKATGLTVQYRSPVGWHPATAMDFSASGCRLRVGESLERGLPLSVVFGTNQADAAFAVQVLGEVVWCRQEGLSYQTGIAFTGDTAPVEFLLAEVS
jgi:hypothetical protein